MIPKSVMHMLHVPMNNIAMKFSISHLQHLPQLSDKEVTFTISHILCDQIG